jgi:hypothetical protein
MQTRCGSRAICLDFNSPEHYDACVHDNALYQRHLDEQYREHPELFPPEMSSGFTFHDRRVSKKTKLKTRRIVLNSSKLAYQIRPAFMMPYMVATTEEVEKALFLRRFGVSYEALAYVFGRDAMFWYRLCVSIGRCSIVGTTVKSPERLPEHLVSDEKHTWIKEERAFVATTVAAGCFLGAEVSMSASGDALADSYGEFATEALDVNPQYSPKTVCADPWPATEYAWKKLFPTVIVILCFLHSVLKIAKCKETLDHLRAKLRGKAWHAYKAPTKMHFSQRMRRLREWAVTNLPAGQLLDAANAMFAKGDSFKRVYDFDNPYRTTNGVDRLIDHQDRLLYAMRYFHSTLFSASLAVRSMALLWNFHPYGLRARPAARGTSSPFSELNGFSYHENWLKNLLIASSMGGWRKPPVRKRS